MQKIASGYCNRPAEDIAEISDLITYFKDSGRGIAPRNRAKLQSFTPDKIQATLLLSDRILSDINAEVDKRRGQCQADSGVRPPKIEMMDAEIIRDVMSGRGRSCVRSHASGSRDPVAP